MAKNRKFSRTVIQTDWDGVAEPVRGKTGSTTMIVLERKTISERAAAAQAATLKRAAESGAPLCEP